MGKKYSCWKKRASMRLRRHDMKAFAYNNSINVVSGSNEETLDSIETYNPEKDEWKAASFFIPNKRGWYGSAILGDQFYVLGGKQVRTEWLEYESGPQYRYFDSVEVLDINREIWTSATPMKVRRAGLSAAACKGRIYVFGGINYDNPSKHYIMDSVDVYNPSTGEWTHQFTMPYPLMAPAVESSGDKIYVIGGYNNGIHSDATYMLDVITGDWKKCASMKNARRDCASIVCRNRIMVFGGCCDSLYTSSCEAYDIENDVWEELPQLPEARAWSAAACVSGRVFIIGGANANPSDTRFLYKSDVFELV